MALLVSACTRASGVPPQEAAAQSPPDVATAGCPSGGRLPPPSSLILFRHDGCVPPTELFGFRCGDDEPPVLERTTGGVTERYVGGRFAVPLDALPADAIPLGEGADMQVYAAGGDPALLYVGVGESVTRWLRLPRRAVANPPTAFVIGDSIADGAAPFLSEALPGWTIGFDTVVGRGTNSAITAAAAQGVARPDVVIIELGTNDADPVAFRENMVTMLDLLRRVPLVVWQTAHGPLTNIPGVNIHIRGTVPTYPNTLIADWDAFVSDDTELSADGVHPLAGHEDLMARLIAPTLSRWLEAATGGSATACAPRAERAAGVR